jgi:hypothetical protein
VWKGDWRDNVGHDGFIVVRLRLFTVGEGGQNRLLQAGLRATWRVGSFGALLPAPFLFADPELRCLRPGEETVVHARPLIPPAWVGVAPGTRLGLTKNPPREIGEGHVVELVDIPPDFVPWFQRVGAPSATLQSRRDL